MKKLICSLFAAPERFMSIISRSDVQETLDDGERVIIDEDGNAIVNIRHPEVQEDFARHVADLRSK